MLVMTLLLNAAEFWAHSQNCEKQLVALACLSVCTYGTTRLLLGGFS